MGDKKEGQSVLLSATCRQTIRLSKARACFTDSTNINYAGN